MFLKPIYNRFAERVQIALYHPERNTIVAIGKFPVNCPQSAINDWVRKHEDLFNPLLLDIERAYTPAS